MTVRSGVRVPVMVAAFVAALTGLAGCTPAGPIGLREQGDKLVVVLGRQCTASTYLTKLRLSNVDENTNDSALPPLWEIEAREPRAVPEVTVGVVPEGFAETANNLAAQPLAERLSMSVSFGDNTFGTTLCLSKIQDGKVLAADEKVMSLDEFREETGCD